MGPTSTHNAVELKAEGVCCFCCSGWRDPGPISSNGGTGKSQSSVRLRRYHNALRNLQMAPGV
ncbi:hypothetical protein C5167_049144 [Papaver somniferum]|uniref:Uncharacterized protein n=1 Tax=Papaver somniferum TaxID=3469 RepID=A0A4Y7KJY7_PAPSO|nr:hypothetical protein C5167_049144 [Papaver somniferum]